MSDSRCTVLPIVAADPPPHAPVLGGARPGLPDLHEADLEPLLAAFYARVADDAALAPYFAALDMAAHIPRIADFWATVLFHSPRYQGNAFRPHLAMPGFTAEHFARWLAALEATVDARHAGEGAERMKAMAHRIAYSMQLRLGLPPSTPDVPTTATHR